MNERVLMCIVVGGLAVIACCALLILGIAVATLTGFPLWRLA